MGVMESVGHTKSRWLLPGFPSSSHPLGLRTSFLQTMAPSPKAWPSPPLTCVLPLLPANGRPDDAQHLLLGGPCPQVIP